MDSKPEKCPQCGGSLELRLGDLECMDCGHIVPRKEPESERKSSGPGFQQWQQPPERAQQAPQEPSYFKGARLQQVAAEHEGTGVKTVFSPHADKEKMILMGIYTFSTLAGIVPDIQRSGALTALLTAGVSLVILAIALYVRVAFIKWTCGTCAGLVGLLGVINLIFSALGMFALPLLNMPPHIFVWAWIMDLLRVLAVLWLASVLFRDIHELQAG